MQPVYKAYEMEELLDIWFFHPLGFYIAKVADRVKASPDQITYLGMLFGIVGGAMLARPSTALAGVGLMVFSSILDSADGQLARMRGGGTLMGRILDGMVGYLMFTSAYIGLSLYYLLLHPGSYGIFLFMIAAGVFSAVQSSLYDYYRMEFARITVEGRVLVGDEADELEIPFRWMYRSYGLYQNFFARSHKRFLGFLAQVYPEGQLDETAKEAYKKTNRRIIHGWNILGDNTRLAAILAAVILSRPQWYFLFIIGPVSVILAVMIFWQSRVDASMAANNNFSFAQDRDEIGRMKCGA